MATDREIALPIDAFLGVDHQVAREDITDYHSRKVQNLWEKEIGVLETRGGSTSFASGWPSNVGSIDNEFRIFKKSLSHARIVAVHPELTLTTPTVPTVTPTWVSDATAYWMKTFAAGGSTLHTEPLRIILRYVGYGIDYSVTTNASSITGYTSTGPLKLRLTVSNLAANPNATGVEIYAQVMCGSTPTENLADEPGDGFNTAWIWAGFVDFVSNPSGGTFDFKYAPFGTGSLTNAAGEVGELERTYLVAPISGGNLVAGKTYYVAVLAQHFKWNADAALCAVEWRQKDTTYLSEIRTITLPATGSIQITSISPSTDAVLVAIGESPQLLIPVGIYNPTPLSGTITITDFPKNSPALVGIRHSSSTLSDLIFRGSDNCAYDMLSRVDDDSTKHPVFISRNTFMNYSDSASINVSFSRAALLGPTSSLRYHPGRRNQYRFVQHGEIAYFVNGGPPPNDTTAALLGNSGRIPGASSRNYFVTDGYIAAQVVADYTASFVNLPFAKEIGKYQESIIIAGGELSGSLYGNTLPDAYSTFYFTQTNNPHNFEVPTTPGAAQAVRVGNGGEPINGIGLFTATTGNEGPDVRFIISKQSSFWILGDLPTASTLSSTFLKELSSKVGAVNSMVFAYTTVGTIIASKDNIYLLRESGEPVPIGDPISKILKGGDLTRAVACFHDEQYKLSFYHPSHPGTVGYNNVEYWLDIKKMKQLQGKPDWKGPMIGRPVDYNLIEDLYGDGTSYDESRDRVVVDRENKRLYKADVTPGTSDLIVYDFSTPVTSLLETKDYQIGEQDKNWNKLITRQYWKLKTCATSPAQSLTETTYVDGVQVESKTISANGLAATAFDEQPQTVFAILPGGRYRGRTLRKLLQTTGRIGIGGLSLFYKVERRRI